MRIYRTEQHGVSIFRLSGVVEQTDALMLLQFLGHTPGFSCGYYILDFQGVEHVDYHVFEIFEDWFTESPNVVLSGLNDYLLDIFAFVHGKNMIPIFSDWRKAFGYMMAEYGELLPLVSKDLVGSCSNGVRKQCSMTL